VVLLLLTMSDSSVAPRFWMYSGGPGVAGFQAGLASGQWYRLVTAAFLHQNLLHLLFNMYALWLFGPPLEAALGRVRYAALYLLGAVSGVAASYAFSALGSASLGASGAVFALFAAHLVVNRRLGRESSGLWTLLAINVALGFVMNGVDWRAHAGGFVGGALASAALVYAPAARRGLVQGVALAAVLVAALGLTTWRTVDVLGQFGAHTDASTVAACEVRHPAGTEGFLQCVS
jgi:membrane associated rhomboid family serine protease